MPYKAVKIKTERIYNPPGSSEKSKEEFPSEWYYVGPQSWTQNESEATVLDDFDATSIISCLEQEYPGIKFKFSLVQ